MIDNVVIWRELELKFWREDKRAVMPCVAYEGTSACFDLIAIRNTVIPAGESAMIPNGLRVLIPEGWYIEFATRSGHGIKYDLRVHPGIIDAGYKGPLSVKMYNLGKEDISILKGKAIVQCKVHRVPGFTFTEITEEEFNEVETIRGENGFGSSDEIIDSEVIIKDKKEK